LEIQDPNEIQNIIRRCLVNGFDQLDKYMQGIFQS
jgi:hypothetical protein